jgi:hypothetical protein
MPPWTRVLYYQTRKAYFELKNTPMLLKAEQFHNQFLPMETKDLQAAVARTFPWRVTLYATFCRAWLTRSSRQAGSLSPSRHTGYRRQSPNQIVAIGLAPRPERCGPKHPVPRSSAHVHYEARRGPGQRANPHVHCGTPQREDAGTLLAHPHGKEARALEAIAKPVFEPGVAQNWAQSPSLEKTAALTD